MVVIKFYFFITIATIFLFSIRAANTYKGGTVYVICRCNEEIHWLMPIASKTVLLNKCVEPNDAIIKRFLEVEQLPNVGRQSQSYLDFIISNYNNLPSEIVFSQARINDHEKYKSGGTEVLVKLGEEARALGYSLNFDLTSENSTVSPNFGIGQFTKSSGVMSHGNDTLSEWMDKYLGGYRKAEKIYWGGIFAIRKDYIQKRSKESYIALKSSLEHFSNPVEGYFFERTWSIVFNIE